MTPLDFNRAVPNIISQEQAEALTAFYAIKEERDEERFKFLGGFNDIFVTIGIVLVLIPFFSLGRFIIPFLAWGLAEYFTRIKKYSLPSIVLTVIFACSVPYFSQLFFDSLSSSPPYFWHFFSIASLLHYWRFRLPIDVAMACGGVVIALLTPIFFTSPHSWTNYNTSGLWVMLALGLAVFTLAMFYDSKDKARVGLPADVAFWLHCLAAPLIVHSTMLLILGEKPQGLVFIGVFASFILFTLVALLIDRRVLVVSCLSYLGIALSALMIKTELGSKMIGSFSTVILLIGLTILGLSIGWQRMRVALLSLPFLSRFHKFLPALNAH